ncbi:MAG: hypothetical protein RSF39_08560, partial [Romboutsia sp.]
MLQNNKGSILITTIIFFSIILVICMSCISMALSNNDYSKLNYEYIKIKESSLSGIEIARSNILSRAKQAIESSNNADEFFNYFLGNSTSYITDISKSELKDVIVSIENRPSKDKEGAINFTMTSNTRNKSYKKTMRVSVKILNPWIINSIAVDD